MTMLNQYTPSSRAAYTNASRYLTRPLGPILAGAALRAGLGLPFLLAGAIKIVYDLGLYFGFRNVPLASAAALYAALRFLEAYGLWRNRRWAEWLAALSGAIYIPFELYELHRGVSWLKLAALLLNAAVLAYMCRVLLTPGRR